MQQSSHMQTMLPHSLFILIKYNLYTNSENISQITKYIILQKKNSKKKRVTESLNLLFLVMQTEIYAKVRF